MSTSPFACTQGTVSSGSLVLIGAIALGATSAFLALGGSMEGALVGNQTRGGIAAGPRSPSHPGPADAATPVPAVSTQAGLGGLPHTAVGLYKKALRSGAARNVGGAPTGARELLHTTSGGTRTRLLLPVAEGSNIPVVAFRPGLAAIGDLYPTIVGKILESG
ncbi:MAG: hypothetical protein KC416_17480, partial [Myxococcales bacterium]|nr:hypothetical protein [Myxococcales bacterium]